MTDVVVAGYPRSGNVWLARLLGDALNRPVTGMGSAMTLAQEGMGRPGPHVVRQLCCRVVEGESDIVHDAWSFWPAAWKGDPQFVHIERGPRDVAASIAAFWDISVREAIEAMAYARWPVGVHGIWREFVEGWRVQPVPQVRFCDLPGALGRILDELGLKPARPLDEVIARQSFEHKRRQIERDGDSRPFGRGVQLKHMRRGKIGAWRQDFTPEDEALALAHFGPPVT